MQDNSNTRGDQMEERIEGIKENTQSQGKNKGIRRSTRIRQLFNQMRQSLADIKIEDSQQVQHVKRKVNVKEMDVEMDHEESNAQRCKIKKFFERQSWYEGKMEATPQMPPHSE